jgi:hypothetical protein
VFSIYSPSLAHSCGNLQALHTGILDRFSSPVGPQFTAYGCSFLVLALHQMMHLSHVTDALSDPAMLHESSRSSAPRTMLLHYAPIITVKLIMGRAAEIRGTLLSKLRFQRS